MAKKKYYYKPTKSQRKRLAKLYRGLGKTRKYLKEQKQLENAIKEELKKLDNLEFFGIEYHAKLSVFDSVRIDTKALKLDFPEIYSEYGKVSVSEKLTINWNGAKDMIFIIIGVIIGLLTLPDILSRKYRK